MVNRRARTSVVGNYGDNHKAIAKMCGVMENLHPHYQIWEENVLKIQKCQ